MLDIIRDYGLYFLVGRFPRGQLGGLAMTFVVALTSLALTFPAAILVALARTGGIVWLQRAARGFVFVIRGVPLLMLVFWVYFFIPKLLGAAITPFWSLVLAIVIFQTAYLSEVIRAAIEALPRGQIEAARSLGLRYLPITATIVLPQALYNAIPGILNQFTAIVKETSLGYIIALDELTYAASRVNNFVLVKPFEIFALLAATYFVVCYSLTRAVGYLETRINRRRAAPAVP